MPSLAVIGHPVAHSRSPDMQTAALAELGLAGEWNYGALDVAPEDFEAEVAILAAEGEYARVNVTVPHKEAALAMADEATEGARAIGAANTLCFRDGRIEAANTNAGGLLRSLPVGMAAGRALVLGAGGAARGAIWALVHGGEGSSGDDGGSGARGAEAEPVEAVPSPPSRSTSGTGPRSAARASPPNSGRGRSPR